MSNEIRTLASKVSQEDPSRPRGDVCTALSDRYRRYALAHLHERDQPASTEELATQVAAIDLDKPLREVTEDERRQMVAELHHVHLPKLEDLGLVQLKGEDRVVMADAPAGMWPNLWDLIEGTDQEREEELNRIFEALSDSTRRSMLAVLEERGEESDRLSAEEVARAVIERDHADDPEPGDAPDIDRFLMSLHHQHLPKLAEADIITYDSDELTLTYEGCPNVHDAWA